MKEEINQACGRSEMLRDYALDELNDSERRSFEEHLAACSDCALELDRLQLTTAALRVLPDREIPRRIAFVAERGPQPSRRGWLAAFWNSGARLGFASACVLAVAIVVSAYHRPVEVRTVSQVVPASIDVTKQVNDAVARAVARVQAEDARNLKTELAAAEERHDRQHEALMVAMEENMTVLQKRLSTYVTLASNEMPTGAGQ